MAHAQRSSEVVEEHGEHVLAYGIGGGAALLLGALLVYYHGMFLSLGVLLVLGGLGAAGYAIREFMVIKNTPVACEIACPYCHAKNRFAELPTSDETCMECHRLMPLEAGRALKVSQVRCGFCNSLNYYSEKSTGLICEGCSREIPIAVAEGSASSLTQKFSHHDDDHKYDLVLTETGHKNDQVIDYLQKLLALNRNQVKQILTELPCTLLSGIPRMKAELIQKDLLKLEAKTNFSETPSAQK